MLPGAADLGAGTKKSRRDLGGHKKIPFMFRGGPDELDDENCFEIAL